MIEDVQKGLEDISVQPEIQPDHGLEPVGEKLKQEHLHDILFSDELSWQAILYDLINTEQLDPWDLDLIMLANKYMEKVGLLEESNFFVSSKVLLAAALLLRIKSEILLNKYIRSLDEILFGKEEEKHYELERIELEEGEIPDLIPKTPLPRFRKVSLQELMSALNKAMATETRRIRREIEDTQIRNKIEDFNLPRKKINLRDNIHEIYTKVKEAFRKKEKIAFSEIAAGRAEKIECFLPILHLDHQEKVWLEQEKHFEEIWILMKRAQMAEGLEQFREEIKTVGEELTKEQMKRVEKVNKDFENPIGEFFNFMG